MRFPDEHGERNHYDCGGTYDSNFPYEDLGEPEPTRESDATRQAGIWDEKSKQYILPSGTVKQGRRPMFLSSGVESRHAHNLPVDERKPLATGSGSSAPPAQPFTPAEFQERIKRQLFGTASVEAERATSQPLPHNVEKCDLAEWFDDIRNREAAAWDEEQSREHEQRQLQEENDNT